MSVDGLGYTTCDPESEGVKPHRVSESNISRAFASFKNFLLLLGQHLSFTLMLYVIFLKLKSKILYINVSEILIIDNKT